MCPIKTHALFKSKKAAIIMERMRIHLQSFSQPVDQKHLDVLDGFRTIFVFLVGWYHIWQQGWLSPTLYIGGRVISLDFLLRSGYIWVDGLMLLSGFLLYLPFANAKGSLQKPLTFYKNRLIRILPSYLLCILFFFVLALAEHKYITSGDAVKDLLAHLTFTHILFPFSYQQTPLNGVLWTLGVEMQFYVLFPLLGRLFRKKPVLTWGAMTAIAFAYRYAASTLSDNSLYINQLPAFLDVYANGFLAASIFSGMHRKMGKDGPDSKTKLFFTVIFVLCACLIVSILKEQAGLNGYDRIRLGQLQQRFPFTILLAVAMIAAAFSLPALRFLLGNRLMAFLSAISLQFYIWHQFLAVRIKEWNFIPHQTDTPWMMGEYAWQVKYIFICFLAAILLAGLITYLFEKPIARKLRK